MLTYRKLLTPLAVTMTIILAPSATFAQGAVGTWAQNGDPNSCSPRSSGHLKVSTTGIEQGSSKCWFGGAAPSGFASVSGNMECTNGVTSVDISAVGNQLTIVKNGDATSYQRCSAGAATEPVFDGGNSQRQQTAPLTQEEQAVKALGDLLGGALSNGN